MEGYDVLEKCQVGDEIYFERTSSNIRVIGEIKEIIEDAYGIFVEVEGIKVENSDINLWRFHTAGSQVYNLQKINSDQLRLAI